MTRGGVKFRFRLFLVGPCVVASHTEWDVICTGDARCIWWRSCYRTMATVPVGTMTELSLISASLEEMMIIVLAISRRCIVGDWQIQNSIVMLSSWWWYPNDKHGSTSIIYKCPLFKQVTELFLAIYPLQQLIPLSYTLSEMHKNQKQPQIHNCNPVYRIICKQKIFSVMPKIQTKKITNKHLAQILILLSAMTTLPNVHLWLIIIYNYYFQLLVNWW